MLIARVKDLFLKKSYSYNISDTFRKYNKYKVQKSIRLLRKTMDVKHFDHLKPPEIVRGMTHLDRKLFEKEIQVPTLQLKIDIVRNILPNLKKYYLKLSNFKSMRENTDPSNYQKHVILDPRLINKWDDFKEDDRLIFETNGITNECFKLESMTLKYENFTVDELLKAILPEDQQGVAGFSQIGHIVHLNLKDHNLMYKSIIGNVILDKIPNCRTVVNKIDQINHKYRNFEMEVLCGDSDMVVTLKENHCLFEFDFSKVYFNPRLGTEHKRLVDKLKPDDILYDVFAGVGPFAIPATKKKCLVIANDLNPDSVKWLRHNAKKNKVNSALLHIHELDGREFIRTILKTDMLTRLREGKTVHIAMNLPALASEFLPEFHGLYSKDELLNVSSYPTVHVYCFAKGEQKEQIALDLIEKDLGHPLKDILQELYFVRTVSNFKHMMRVSFKLTLDILTNKRNDEPVMKKMRCGDLQDEQT